MSVLRFIADELEAGSGGSSEQLLWISYERWCAWRGVAQEERVAFLAEVRGLPLRVPTGSWLRLKDIRQARVRLWCEWLERQGCEGPMGQLQELRGKASYPRPPIARGRLWDFLREHGIARCSQPEFEAGWAAWRRWERERLNG